MLVRVSLALIAESIGSAQMPTTCTRPARPPSRARSCGSCGAWCSTKPTACASRSSRSGRGRWRHASPRDSPSRACGSCASSQTARSSWPATAMPRASARATCCCSIAATRSTSRICSSPWKLMTRPACWSQARIPTSTGAACCTSAPAGSSTRACSTLASLSSTRSTRPATRRSAASASCPAHGPWPGPPWMLLAMSVRLRGLKPGVSTIRSARRLRSPTPPTWPTSSEGRPAPARRSCWLGWPSCWPKMASAC